MPTLVTSLTHSLARGRGRARRAVWREKLRCRDPMRELDLPRDIKNHHSWARLAEMKWQKEWHDEPVHAL